MLNYVPKLERVLVRSIKAFFPGLLRIERLAKEMSAVTLVMVILESTQITSIISQSEEREV